MKNTILTVFTLTLILVSCSKIETTDNNDNLYNGVKSKQEFYDLAKTNDYPFNLLNEKDIKEFGEKIIFDEKGNVKGCSLEISETLDEEAYHVFFQKVFAGNAHSYGEKEYSTQKTNSFYDPSLVGYTWAIHASPKGPNKSCEFSHMDCCWFGFKKETTSHN